MGQRRSTLRPLSFRGLRQFATGLLAVMLTSVMLGQMFSMRERDQVLRPIVVLDPVDVMSVFIIAEQSAQLLLKHETVFQHVALEGGTSARLGMIRLIDVDITGHHPATSEIPMRLTNRLDTVALDEGSRVTLKQPLGNIGFVGELRPLAASAFTETTRRLTCCGDVMPHVSNSITGA